LRISPAHAADHGGAIDQDGLQAGARPATGQRLRHTMGGMHDETNQA
jgi:hypothetical protein